MRSRFLVLGLVLSFTFPVLAQAETSSVGDAGKAWEIPNDADRGQQIFTILDNSFGQSGSYLVKRTFKVGVDTEDPTCASLADPKCSSTQYDFRAILKQCDNMNTINCISDFGVVDAEGTRTSGVFQEYFPDKAQNEFVGDASSNVPNGGTGSVYQVKSAPFQGGDKYYVEATLTGGGGPNSQVNPGDFSVYVFPVAIRTGITTINNWPNAGISKLTDSGAGHTTGTYVYASPGLISGTSCLVISGQDKRCLERYAFPANINFYVTLKLKKEPNGWMHGRISNPTIKITDNKEFVSVDIQAEPIAVPVVYKMYRWATMPSDLRSKYDLVTGGYLPDNPVYVEGSGCGRSACNPDPEKRNVIISPAPYSDSAFNQLLLWLPYVKDKAQAMYGNWSVRTLSGNELNNANVCFTGKQGVTGIVSSNSSTYSPGPPYLNRNTNSLDYKVAAPHFTSADSDTVFKGSYDLLMRSDVARCVYGFTSAPISATISVSSSDGEASVATTIFNERAGWVQLRAAGFTFSSPTISVKFDQKSAPAAPATPVVVSPSVPSSAPTVSAAKKTSITCVKGKSIKVVTAAKPTCPSGYKKK